MTQYVRTIVSVVRQISLSSDLLNVPHTSSEQFFLSMYSKRLHLGSWIMMTLLVNGLGLWLDGSYDSWSDWRKSCYDEGLNSFAIHFRCSNWRWCHCVIFWKGGIVDDFSGKRLERTSQIYLRLRSLLSLSLQTSTINETVASQFHCRLVFSHQSNSQRFLTALLAWSLPTVALSGFGPPKCTHAVTGKVSVPSQKVPASLISLIMIFKVSAFCSRYRLYGIMKGLSSFANIKDYNSHATTVKIIDFTWDDFDSLYETLTRPHCESGFSPRVEKIPLSVS